MPHIKSLVALCLNTPQKRFAGLAVGLAALSACSPAPTKTAATHETPAGTVAVATPPANTPPTANTPAAKPAVPASLPTPAEAALEAEGAFSFELRVSATKTEQVINPRLLGGTNIALWNEAAHFKSPLIKQWIDDLQAALIRIPGGSWSNAYYWNGHGVRDKNGQVDTSKVGPDGYPAVDYSGYAPGFNVDTKTLKPADGFHGNVDVKTLHDWVKSIPGASPMPCLNAGSGRAVDAGEWVKWSTAQNYGATYWEIGNELDGSWEPGYHLPNGQGTITEAIWSERYRAIGSAIRKEQPNAKIGACAFHLPLVRDGGDLVDFVAIHAYPGSTTVSSQENLARAPEVVATEVAKVRKLIDKYQPERKDRIEVGFTEWNLSGGLNSADLFSGIWTSSFLSAFAKNGVTFATHWDIFTHSKGMRDGHGLIFTDGSTYTRKAGYYAMWLWNNFTGSRVLGTASSGDVQGVQSLATRDAEVVYLLLINPNYDKPAQVTIKLDDFTPAARGEVLALTAREYFWNPYTSQPDWSSPPRSRELATGGEFTVTLPPFSVSHVRVPSATHPELSAYARSQAPLAKPSAAPVLNFILPPEIYVGDRATGFLHASLPGGSASYPVALPAATLSVSGNATLDREQVRLAEAFGRFNFTLNDDKPVTFIARVNGVEQRFTLQPKPSVPRPVLFWDFQKQSPTDAKAFTSGFALRADASQRPNKEVARIDLAPGSAKIQGNAHRVIYKINNLPPAEQLDRSNIRGMFFDVKTLGYTSPKANSRLSVVMQSPADYWMVLGSIPLDGTTDWKRIQFDVTRESYIKAMAASYNIWFVLDGDEGAHGTICLDRIGLMVR